MYLLGTAFLFLGMIAAMVQWGFCWAWGFGLMLLLFKLTGTSMKTCLEPEEM